MENKNPKEKAKSIYHQYMNLGIDDKTSIHCAIITINEIIKQWEYIDTYLADLNGELNPNLKYWYEVKNAINEG